MHYKLIIIDNNIWMYTDMAHQICTQLSEQGHVVEICHYEIGENTNTIRYIFLGTAYAKLYIPPKSIVTNFDNDTHLFTILTPSLIQTCTVWDYSQENIDLIRKYYPNSDCYLFQMGYSPLLDHKVMYTEEDKDIDVLLLGSETKRRMNVLNLLKRSGYNVVTKYNKIGIERAELIRRSKICISIYSNDHTHCTSASRFTPILCNNGFIVTENCSNKEMNDYWSKYTISIEYDEIYDTVVTYLKQPEKRKELADKYYQDFKQTRSKVLKM